MVVTQTIIFWGLTVTVAPTAFHMAGVAQTLLLKRVVLVKLLVKFKIRQTFSSLEKECEHGEVRLVGGVANSTGRLEFCAHGMWGRVCNALQYWGPDNARVVCQQLGFSEEGEISYVVLTPISFCCSYVQVHMFLTMSRDLEQVKEMQ